MKKKILKNQETEKIKNLFQEDLIYPLKTCVDYAILPGHNINRDM